MRDDAVVKMSMSEMGRAIGRGDLDPVSHCEAYFDRIAASPHAGRIYARLTRDTAMAEARDAASRARAGTRRGLLDGVPVSWKDLFDTAGVATEAGSRLLAGRIPARDAAVVARAREAGLIGLGKTHMSELAFSGLGLNPATRTPPCVNDPDAVPGGSSSGAAASVAFGLAPGAVGSDTGGSVRIPAAFNDLVGFKPTHGRLPLDGVVPLAARFDTVGTLTRTVEDAAELVCVLEGVGGPDLHGARLDRARLLVLESVAFDDIRDGPRAGFEAAVARLEAAGAQVERGRVPAVEAAMELSAVLYTAEAYGAWRETIEAAPHLMFDRILERFRAGAAFSGADYVAGWRRLGALRRDYLGETVGYDAVLLPTAPILPPDADRLMRDGDYYVTENLLALRNTRIGNLMGLCALTLPTGTASTGFMIQCPPGQDRRLLRIGAAAEAALA